jgi:hypothetical protein
MKGRQLKNGGGLAAFRRIRGLRGKAANLFAPARARGFDRVMEKSR